MRRPNTPHCEKAGCGEKAFRLTRLCKMHRAMTHSYYYKSETRRLRAALAEAEKWFRLAKLDGPADECRQAQMARGGAKGFREAPDDDRDGGGYVDCDGPKTYAKGELP